MVLADDPESGSVELSPGITAELNAQGEWIGVEILNASAFIRDTILETVQARVLAQEGAQAVSGGRSPPAAKRFTSFEP